MSHPLIYASDNGQVVVLDLPTSIGWAQGAHHLLRSIEAVVEPYETPEPKGKKLVELRNAIPQGEHDYRADIEKATLLALEEAERYLQSHGRAWCLNRVCADREILATPQPALHNICPASNTVPPPLILSSVTNLVGQVDISGDSLVHNPTDKAVDLVVNTGDRYYIPSESTFLNATIVDGYDAFSQAARTFVFARQPARVSHLTFDLILLDPPWGNRSVRNSKAYHSAEDQVSDPFWQTIPILQGYLADQGCVAIWITNKSKVREKVIAAFATLKLRLVEEWVWIKVTSAGDPIMPLNGLWRKPYEIVLLFGCQRPTTQVKRKILIAVPDVHSRKPSLKCIFDNILPSKYQALELFARGLTSGWWSWGNEVLKFQHESCWVPIVTHECRQQN